MRNDTWAEADVSFRPPHHSIRLISQHDAAYPCRLRAIKYAPAHIYVIGSLSSSHPLSRSHPRAPIAIVGSRQASTEGLTAAYMISKALAERGHTVVSGFAAGIDTEAHRGALAAGGHTIAVVGTGIDCAYPPENAELRSEIIRTGAIVSQFPIGHQPSKTSFPARNAIIAALSDASLVIESTARSGTLIEANLALEQGKPVLLWEPILKGQLWARQFARNVGVDFVASIADIKAALPSPAPR